jgi:hypothetical protein
MRGRSRRLRQKLSREERLDLIRTGAARRAREKVLACVFLLFTVTGVTYYTVSNGIVEDYRALMLCAGLPTIGMFIFYDPLRMMVVAIGRAFRSPTN